MRVSPSMSYSVPGTQSHGGHIWEWTGLHDRTEISGARTSPVITQSQRWSRLLPQASTYKGTVQLGVGPVPASS